MPCPPAFDRDSRMREQRWHMGTASPGRTESWTDRLYGTRSGCGWRGRPAMVVRPARRGVRDPDLRSRDRDASGPLSAGLSGRRCRTATPIPSGARDNGNVFRAAVVFDALGDREAASFFSPMGGRLRGTRGRPHRQLLWHVLVVAGRRASGPLATGAYLRETDWYYDLGRGWDGRFLFQGRARKLGRDGPAGMGLHRRLHAGLRPAVEADILTGRKPSVVPALSPRRWPRQSPRGATSVSGPWKTPTRAATPSAVRRLVELVARRCVNVRRWRWADARATSCRDC